MIIDSLSKSDKYFFSHPKFKEAFQYIRQLQVSNARPGSYVADDGIIFGTIQDAHNVVPEQAKFEGHEKYIDIQVVLEGSMDIYVTACDGLTVAENLTPKRDLLFFHTPAEWNTLHLSAGDFAVLYPGEAHAPGVVHGNGTTVRKLVLKVLAQV